jgi:pimeloyl-ACP methyl ester carboxylesterase
MTQRTPLDLWVLAGAGLVAACAGGGQGAPGTPPPGEPPPPAATPIALVARVLTVNGTQLHYIEAGSGDPLIFVHGSLGSLDSWRAQIDTFARHYRVISYSRRFHPPNRPIADDQGYALERHADDLARLIEGLRLERVHLVASSYGAYTALRLALKRPELVRSLVLGEPPILPWLSRSPAGDSLRRDFQSGVIVPTRAAFDRGDSVGALRRFVDGVSGTPGRFASLPASARGELLRQAFEMRLEMHADPDTYMPALSCREVAGIMSPALLVTGDQSPRLFHVISDELERCLVTEEKVSVPGAGHAMHTANPAFYNAVVLRFLTTH